MSIAPFTMRNDLSPARKFTLFGTAFVLTFVLQYFWLYEDTPLLVRVWAFTLHPAWLAPAIVLPFILSVRISEGLNFRGMLGSFSSWSIGLVVPVGVFAIALSVHTATGGTFDPKWTWITYALSTLADLPLLLVLILPMSAIQLLVWMAPWIEQPTGRGFAFRTSFLWTAAHLVTLAHVARTEDPLVAASMAVLFLGSGVFVARLMSRSTLITASLALLIILECSFLMFGCGNEAITQIFFGADVASVDGILPRPLWHLYLASIGGTLLLAGLVLPSGRRLV